MRELGARVADIARHAKVGNLEHATVVEEKVGGFEVAVQNGVGV